MKVLVISHMYPSSFNTSDGIVVFQLGKELQNLGCQVKVVSPKPCTPFPVKYLSHKWMSYSQIPTKTIQAGIEVYYPRYLLFPRAMFFSSSGKRMYSGIRKLVEEIHQDFKFDIIHAHMALPDGFAAMLLSKQYDLPLVITPRGADVDITMLRGRPCFNAVNAVFQNSNAVISPSAQIRAKLLHKINLDTVILPWGIYAEDLFAGKSNLRQNHTGRIIVLSVSSLIPSKGLDLNIEAVARIKKKYPAILYLIVGQGRWKHQLTRLAHDLNIQDSVEFLGQLPHTKVMEYMSICDVFSLPSWQETLGLVYLEAMAHGKPIIGCQGQGVDELVVNGETGLMVKPKDLDSLAQAMEFLLGNPDKAHEIGERARKLILENYTWGKNAQRYMKIYEELVSANR